MDYQIAIALLKGDNPEILYKRLEIFKQVLKLNLANKSMTKAQV
jgi:SOS-response transcriptional repressor LexA